MLRAVLCEEVWYKNDKWRLTPFERVSFFKFPSQKVQHEDGIIATELVITHRKLYVL